MRKPNILLINCDDLGYGDLGCYGSTVNETPFIDSLAKEGMRFTSFYSASPVCSPSRASLMTGCFPPRVDINRVLFPGEPDGLNQQEYTIANLCKDNGYSTMIIGKWHCGDQVECLPTNFGFDDYYGLPYSNDMGIQKNTEQQDLCNRNPYARPPLPLIHGTEVIEQQPDQRSLTERYVEKAKEFMRANADKPFLLYFAQMHVHLPLYAVDSFVRASKNGDFGACVAEVDWSCKALVYELKRLGIYEDTLIIFTSDNGSKADYGASNAPLRSHKFTTWEGGMRVPFIAHWHNHIQPNLVNDNIGCNIDMLPTIARLIGGEVPTTNPIDGLDISPCFYDTGSTVRDEMVYFLQSNKSRPYLNAVRKGDWKLHFAFHQDEYTEPHLYNLREDIGETNNVYSEHPAIVAKLEEIAEKYRLTLGDEHRDITGTEIRKRYISTDPKPLTTYDEDHPYIIAIYDKTERG